jgi:hypothetical protein
MLLLPEGQTGETWDLQKSIALSEIGEQWIGTYCHFVLKGSSKHDFTMANNINIKTQNLGS